MSFKREARDLEDRIEAQLQTFAGLLSRQDGLDWDGVNDMDLEIQKEINNLRNLTQDSSVDKKIADDYSRHLIDYNREHQRVKVVGFSN